MGGMQEQQEHFAISIWKNYANEKMWPVQGVLMANLYTVTPHSAYVQRLLSPGLLTTLFIKY